MSTSRKVLLNVVFSAVSKVLGTVLALVGIGFITRYLGQDGFGLYTVALAFFLFFNSFGDLGLHQTMTRKISQPEADQQKIIGNAVGIRLTASLVIALLTPLFIHFLPYSKELKVGIFLTCLAFLFSSIFQLLVGIFQKNLSMEKIAAIEFFGKIVQLTLVLVGVKFDLGFAFILTSILGAMFFNFIATFILANKFSPIRPAFDFNYWKKFLSESLPIGLSVIITFAYFKADSILLSLFQPSQEVGIYGAAYKIIENLSFFPGMIVGLTMPMFAYSINSDTERFRRLVNKNFKVFVILVFPLIAGTLILSDEIINLIAGPAFHESATVLRIIIFAMAFIFFGQLANNIMIAGKLQKELLKVLFISAIFSLVLNLIFIPKYSYLATSAVSVITEAVVAILGFWVIRKKLNYSPKVDKLPAIFLSTALMSLCLIIFRDVNIIFKVLLSPAIYFFFIVVTETIKKEELLEIIKKQPNQ